MKMDLEHTTPTVKTILFLGIGEPLRTLEFTARDGETFILRPGDVLVSEDNAGTATNGV